MGLYCDLIRLSNEEAQKCRQLGSEEEIYALVQQEDGADEDWFDIDKAWHGIHFILTGLHSADPSPLDFLMPAERC